MRISDWSSDVCSSDLECRGRFLDNSLQPCQQGAFKQPDNHYADYDDSDNDEVSLQGVFENNSIHKRVCCPDRGCQAVFRRLTTGAWKLLTNSQFTGADSYFAGTPLPGRPAFLNCRISSFSFSRFFF